MNAPRFDLIGAGGVGGYWWTDRPMPPPKRRHELESAIDGQGETSPEPSEKERRAIIIAGGRSVLKAIDAAPKLDLNRVGPDMTRLEARNRWLSDLKPLMPTAPLPDEKQ